MKMFFYLFLLMSANLAHATQKLFYSTASSLGTFLPLPGTPSTTVWATAGNLDFNLANNARVLVNLILDAKLDTCTGACPTPKPGGSMMVEVRISNATTGELVFSQRMNGGFASLAGGVSGAAINHMLVLPVSLQFPSRSVLAPGNYRATVLVKNYTAMNMQYALRQIVTQVFEE